jgi:hypothetical protein
MGVASSSCSSSTGGAGLSDSCAINSDCDAPLICAFAQCHDACAESRDCPDGERCLLSGTGGTCQLTQDSTCSVGIATCQIGQACGTDMQCRELCATTSDCARGDVCLPTGTTSECYSPSNAIDEAALITAGILSPDGAVLADGSIGTGTSPPDGSMVGSKDGSGGSVVDAPTGNACPSAQTQFSSTAQGDSNPDFTSGVGARTSSQLLAFDSYVGPDPSGEAGTDNIGAIYQQAFDPVSGASAGPAAYLATVKNLDVLGHDIVYSMTIESSGISPSGRIALVYLVRFLDGHGAYDETDLYATFIDASGDGGAGLSVDRTVLLTTAPVYEQPYAIWSTTSDAFVFSWYDADGGEYVTIQKFLANGSPAGGNSTVVPTDSPQNMVVANSNVAQGAVAESQGFFGVGYSSAVTDYATEMTVLDPTGTPIGSSILVVPESTSGSSSWTAVGGTSQGFVYFYDDENAGGVGEVFLPTAAGIGVVGAGSDASTFTGFSFPGTVRATAARAVDDSAGAGGVGLALLYASGVSFAYVQPDGSHHVGPSPVFPHATAAADYTSLTNLNGSFVVSLYSSANHATEVAASGCTP